MALHGLDPLQFFVSGISAMLNLRLFNQLCGVMSVCEIYHREVDDVQQFWCSARRVGHVTPSVLLVGGFSLGTGNTKGNGGWW